MIYAVFGIVAGFAGLMLPVLAITTFSERSSLRPPIEPHPRAHAVQNHTSKMEAIEIKAIEMRWPSLTAQPSKGHDLEWPSTSWDDPHFGQWQKLTDGASAPSEPTKTATPAKVRKAKPRAKSKASGLRSAPARSSGEPKSNAGGPTRAQIESLIEHRGIAGAVEALMSQYECDFRTAARMLAQARGQ